MKHTCYTARSGSERSENTCAACHDELKRSKVPQGYGDLTNEWERMTASIGRNGPKKSPVIPHATPAGSRRYLYIPAAHGAAHMALDWKQNDRGIHYAEVGFGVTDAQGRAMGMQVVVTASGEVSVWAMRDGKTFGAARHGTQTSGVDEGKALGAKKVAAAQARARRVSRRTQSPPDVEPAGDAECIECGKPYFSGDGHKTQPICPQCK